MSPPNKESIVLLTTQQHHSNQYILFLSQIAEVQGLCCSSCYIFLSLRKGINTNECLFSELFNSHSSRSAVCSCQFSLHCFFVSRGFQKTPLENNDSVVVALFIFAVCKRMSSRTSLNKPNGYLYMWCGDTESSTIDFESTCKKSLRVKFWVPSWAENLQPHLLGAVSDEHGKRFHQHIPQMEK